MVPPVGGIRQIIAGGTAVAAPCAMRTTLLLAVSLTVLAGCASTLSDEGWEDWGGFTLTDDQYAVHHRVREGAHRLELLRKHGERDGGEMRWDVLDAVPLELPEKTLV